MFVLFKSKNEFLCWNSYGRHWFFGPRKLSEVFTKGSRQFNIVLQKYSQYKTVKVVDKEPEKT